MESTETRTTSDRAVQRREQLLEVGRRHFLRRPYDDVSLDEVADEAGVSHGLLFHYFGSKRGFYVESLRSFLERRPADVSLEGKTGRERLHAGLAEHVALVEDQAENFRLLLHGGPGAEDAHAMLEEFRRRAIRRVLDAGGIREPTPRQLVAMRGWVGFVEGAVQEWLAGGRPFPRGELIEMLADALLNAVRPGQPE